MISKITKKLKQIFGKEIDLHGNITNKTITANIKIKGLTYEDFVELTKRIEIFVFEEKRAYQYDINREEEPTTLDICPSCEAKLTGSEKYDEIANTWYRMCSCGAKVMQHVDRRITFTKQ